MDFYDVCIPTFINPHLFWIIDVRSKERTNALKQIDKFCKNYNFSSFGESSRLGDLVIISKNEIYYRAVIKEVYGDDQSVSGYSCWLMDYAKMHITNKVYKMPEELQNIPPLAHQASLYNIIYYSQSLELGANVETKRTTSIIPAANITRTCVDFLEKVTTINFKVALEDGNIYFGDLVVKRKSDSLSLTDYLAVKRLVAIDAQGFKRVKSSIEIYKRTHIAAIQEISSQQKGFGGKNATINFADYEETDAYHAEPILTGRRKNLNVSTTSEDERQPEEEKFMANKQEHKKMDARQKVKEFLLKKRLEAEGDTESDNNESQLSSAFDSAENSKNSTGNDAAKPKPSVTGFGDFLKNEQSPPLPSNVIFGPNAKSISQVYRRKTSGHNQGKHHKRIRHSEHVEAEPAAKSASKAQPDPAEIPEGSSTEESEASTPKVDAEHIKHMLGCACKNCHFWALEDDWENDVHFEQPKKNERAEPKVNVKRPAQLLWKKDEEMPEKHIYAVEYRDMSRVQKMAAPKLIVHGEIIPAAVQEVKKVQFHQDIHNSLGRLQYREAKKIQIYSWTALFRGQHVFMVGDPKSGKTMSYLPVLCSFLLEKDERYKPLLKMGGGPIVLILCNSSKKCEDVYDLIKVLFGSNKVRLSLITYPNERLNTSNIDILVTMPTILAPLLLTRAINFKRLCHFVLEDGDSLLKHHSTLMSKFLNLAQDMLDHRSCDKTIQMVACAEHWSSHIEGLAKKLRRVPLVLISNYIEASMYGNVGFVLKLLETTRKELEMKNVLENCFKFEKSLVLCRDDEVDEIANMLMFRGIEYLTVKEDMDIEDTICNEEIWNTVQPGDYPVLICSDAVFNSVLNVTSADLVIHYTLPNTWSQFVRRFSSFLENCKSPFDSKHRKIKCRSMVFIDETCENMMAKFLNLLINSEQQLSPNVESYLMGLRLKQETERIKKDIEICDTLKLFGKCDNIRCSNRHKVDQFLDQSDYLPKNGILKFKILEILDVTSFKIEVLEHVDFDNNINKIVNKSDVINEHLTRLPRERVKIPCVGHLYMYHEDDIFSRCKIIGINKDNVTVSLIDTDKSYIVTPIRNLYRLPEQYKKLRPQTNIATMYLANFIPPHKDETFSTKSYRLLEEALQRIFYRDATFRAQILLTLGHCFWLRDVEQERQMFDRDLPTSGYQLYRAVRASKFAETDETQLKNLRELCAEAQMELPDYEPPKKVVGGAPQAGPQWAFLDADETSEVVFGAAVSPEEFTVRLAKFGKQLSNLQQEISRVIHKPFYPEIDKVIEGNCYLAKEIEGDQYCRVLARKVEGDKCVCYFVDYGDETVVEISKLKYLSDNLINVLPFQAIQCRLRGVKPIGEIWWFNDSDILYEYALEPNSDVFRSLYVKVCDKEENKLIPRQRKYAILLKDGYGEKKVLINRMMVECGLAMENEESLEDFAIPETNTSETDFDEDMEVLDVRKKEESIIDEPIQEMRYENGYEVIQVDEMDDMEFNIADPRKLYEDFVMGGTENEKQIKNVPRKSELPEMKALPPAGYRTPTVFWSQTKDVIKLTIDLADVKDYAATVVRNRIFTFSCQKASLYKLKLMLFDSVDKTFQHTAFGPHVRVTLKKTRTGSEWPRLVVTSDRMRHIRYDLSTVDLDEEKERRFLDLNISDEEGESDGEIDMMYEVVSDIDSDYDHEIPRDMD